MIYLLLSCCILIWQRIICTAIVCLQINYIKFNCACQELFENFFETNQFFLPAVNVSDLRGAGRQYPLFGNSYGHLYPWSSADINYRSSCTTFRFAPWLTLIRAAHRWYIGVLYPLYRMCYHIKISLSGACAAMAVHLSTFALTLTVSKSLLNLNAMFDGNTFRGWKQISAQISRGKLLWSLWGASSLVLSVSIDRKYKKKCRKLRHKTIYPKRREKQISGESAPPVIWCSLLIGSPRPCET